MITNHRLSILHRPKRPSAAQKNLEHADVEYQKEQVRLFYDWYSQGELHYYCTQRAQQC